MRILKTHVLLRFLNSYLVDSPQPANISYLWNFGSLLAICLIIQILTGAFLAMHYTPNVDFAFNSVEHIMRDVNNGWLIRYTHANVASFFFIFVYMHIGRGLYYGSYKSPRVLVWSIGVVIFIIMMATAFLGYVLPYGQMSLWGEICPKCVNNNYLELSSLLLSKIRSKNRIGVHNYDILSIIFGSLLGDAHAEKHGNGTRIAFYQENTHKDYLLWLHNLISSKSYCNENIPVLQTRLGNYGKLRNIIRFKTFTYSSFNWIQECWYINNKKVLPQCINDFLSPLALALWIMDDGAKVSSGIKLLVNNFDLTEVIILCNILTNQYNITATPNSASDKNKKQYVIYIHKESMINLSNIVSPFIHPSMKYKLNNYL